jgi:hypothetical protein
MEQGGQVIAQADIGQLPAGFIKDALLLITAAVVIICLVVGAIVGIGMWLIERKRDARELAKEGEPPQPVQIEQPVGVMKIFPAATVRELNEKHSEHDKRLDSHDVQIGALWNTMREEDKQIRKEVADQYQTISRALGRIEGKLETDSEGI